MGRTVYRSITALATKVGKCACGKQRKRSARFYQTVSEFNRNALGHIKGSAEIRKEVEAEREAWLSQPITCNSCDATNPGVINDPLP